MKTLALLVIHVLTTLAQRAGPGGARAIIADLREELHARGILIAVAHEKRSMKKHFEGNWVNARRQLSRGYSFPTPKAAARAFNHRGDRGDKPGSRQVNGPVGQVLEPDSLSD